MIKAPDLAGDAKFAEDLRSHYVETEQQADLVQQRLEAYGESVSAVKNAIMKLGGKGFLLFARLQPETPGRLAAHAYAYEAMEWAGYEMLLRFAEEEGESETADVARTVGDQERRMMERIEGDFDGVEEASHRGLTAADLDKDLPKHVAEAHALESQAIHLLGKSEKIAGDAKLTASAASSSRSPASMPGCSSSSSKLSAKSPPRSRIPCSAWAA